ncbi:MAG: glycerol kinase [Bacilli bacterium]|nr:glycerol kinase [Bacilli bacterium]
MRAVRHRYILAIDQGTTSCRAIVFDHQGRVVQLAQEEFTQFYPQPGWVEHDASEIWNVQLKVMQQAVKGIEVQEIAAIGITNQRETLVVWDKQTGNPVCPAIVWQCRRTASLCEQLREGGFETVVREKTGLLLDPYFTGTKLMWLLDNHDDIRGRAVKGELLAGTIDSWLIWKLTHGRNHVTDITNASRTSLFNIHQLTWDEELLELFHIPAQMLPEVKPSSGMMGVTDFLDGQTPIPISGVAGDQQAALFGQTCFDAGMAKNTYGTGCFLLMNTGRQPVASQNGLLTTVAWEIDGQVEYALEGSVFVAGAAIQWLRDGLGIVSDAGETEALATSVDDTCGVYFVPAFTGLGTPYWNAQARGMITGLTRGTQRAHLVRAALEAIAYQSLDVLSVMKQEAGIPLTELRVDGGAVRNNFLMQFQADLLGAQVTRPAVQETTALGAALLAGLSVGFWRDRQEIAGLWSVDRIFAPTMKEQDRLTKYAGWQSAVGYQAARN